MKKIVFLGECPGPSGKKGFEGWSGQRLLRLCRDVPNLQEQAVFLNVFNEWQGPATRHNERGGKGSCFSISKAKRRAPFVASRIRRLSPTLVVLLGKRVALSFGLRLPFMAFTYLEAFKAWATIIPHPSGVVRWWNTVDNVSEFQNTMSDVFDEHFHPLSQLA